MLGFIKHLFKLQFLIIFVAILAGVYYTEITKYLGDYLINEPNSLVDSEQIFTKQQLATFNGENKESDRLYLAILGKVFDVTKGIKHYGPGCSYNYFIGRDASVSFVSGEFTNFVEEEADNVLTLKSSDLLSLNNWLEFYEKEYIYKGKLIGRFYDVNGEATAYYHKFLALVEQERNTKKSNQQLKAKYPDCNIEWSAEKGTHVWCTDLSGGIERNWIGHPRKLFAIGSTNFRCACIQEKDFDTKDVMLKMYNNCERLAQECYYSV